MKLFIVFMISLTTWPCFAFYSEALQGGVSGGGGNLIAPVAPSVPADPEAVEHLVYNSENLAFQYVTDKKIAYDDGRLSAAQLEVLKPIFKSTKNIQIIMRTIRVHVAEHSSCWDAQRNPVDGSTISVDPNSICISALNIANKASVSDIQPQSAALMIHEYSELVGLSEEQAVRLQTEALKEFRGNLQERK